MNLDIVILEYAQTIRDEKIHWWDNLVIQYIQVVCWLAVPRPDQLNQPQIITLQFADLNQNYNLFWPGNVCLCINVAKSKTKDFLKTMRNQAVGVSFDDNEG